MPKMDKSAEEKDFRQWYAGHAKKLGLAKDPYDKEHHYDYKAAYRKKQGPGPDNHWPSENKTKDHPNRYVNGVDTITGKKVKGK